MYAFCFTFIEVAKMVSNKPVDQYSLALEALADGVGGQPVRAIATNLGDKSFAETRLSLQRTHSLLAYAYGGEQTLVDEYMERLREHHSLEFRADAKTGCIFTSNELVQFGFDPDDLKM
jgi:hypothetical protein